MNIEKLLGLGGVEEIPDLADDIEFRLKRLEIEKRLSTADLLREVEVLQDEIQKIKENGISMWNYKSVIPKIFDTVDGAFVVIKEIIKKLEEKK